MAKARTQFLCNSCGSVHPKWMGKCPDCGTWDSLEEYKAPTPDPRAASLGRSGGGATGDIARGGGVVPGSAVLVGGEPGIGKSTLLLQVAHELARERSEVAGPMSGKNVP